jgi:prolipoprotein diacylglyceryltransferase
MAKRRRKNKSTKSDSNNGIMIIMGIAAALYYCRNDLDKYISNLQIYVQQAHEYASMYIFNVFDGGDQQGALTLVIIVVGLFIAYKRIGNS